MWLTGCAFEFVVHTISSETLGHNLEQEANEEGGKSQAREEEGVSGGGERDDIVVTLRQRIAGSGIQMPLERLCRFCR